MPLIVEQLIYTSFPEIGFKSIVSSGVSTVVEQIFSQQIIDRLWDTYKPPEKNYLGVYLYQLDHNKTLFGWMRNDGSDDYGRGDIPYFHAYYLTQTLDRQKLNSLLSYLETGPIERVDRRHIALMPRAISLPDNYRSRSPELGVKLSKKICLFSHQQLQKGKLLQWFCSAREEDKPSPPVAIPERGNISELAIILQELAAKPIAIQGLVLVSKQGKPLTPPLGMDENSASLLAGSMLYLIENTREELRWSETEQVIVKSPFGNLILTTCNRETFLLVKTGRTISGLLESEIQKTKAKLTLILDGGFIEGKGYIKKLEPEIPSLEPPLPDLETIFNNFESDLDTEANSPSLNHRDRN